MSDIGSPSRPDLSPPEGTGRVAPLSTPSDKNPSPQQQPGKQQSQKDKDATPLPKGHDPAVNLSASLASLQPGHRIAGELNGHDEEGRPLLVTQQGTYVLTPVPNSTSATTATTALPLQDQLPQQGTVTLAIKQVDKNVRADLIFTERPQTAVETASTASRAPIPVMLTLTELGQGTIPSPQLPNTTDPAAFNPQTGQNPQSIYQENLRHTAERLAHNLQQIKNSDFLLPASTASYQTAKTVAADRPAAALPHTLLQQLQTAPLSGRLDAFNALPPQSAKIAALPVVAPLSTLGTATPLNFRAITLSLPGTDTAPTALQTIPPKGPLTHFPFQVHVTASHFHPSALNGALNKETAPFTITANVPISTTQMAEITLQSPVALPVGTLLTLQFQAAATQDNTTEKTSVNTTTTAVPPANAPDIQTRQEQTTPLIGKADTESHSGAIPPSLQDKVVESHTPRAEQQPPSGANTTPPVTSSTGQPPASGTAPPPSSPPALLAQPPQPLPELLQNWQVLSHLHLNFAPIATAASNNIINNFDGRLPSLSQPQQLPASILFFLAAIGQNNAARLWLGPDISQQLEQQGHRAALARLDNDLQRIGQMFNDPANTEWRPAIVPLQTQDGLQALAFLFRPPTPDTDHNQGDPDDIDPHKKDTTRFIVEMNLTRLGALQLDGLLKPQQLDIILRSHTPLSSTIKSDIQNIFQTALSKADYQGRLDFQVLTPFPVSAKDYIRPLDTPPGHDKVII